MGHGGTYSKTGQREQWARGGRRRGYCKSFLWFAGNRAHSEEEKKRLLVVHVPVETTREGGQLATYQRVCEGEGVRGEGV